MQGQKNIWVATAIAPPAKVAIYAGVQFYERRDLYSLVRYIDNWQGGILQLVSRERKRGQRLDAVAMETADVFLTATARFESEGLNRALRQEEILLVERIPKISSIITVTLTEGFREPMLARLPRTAESAKDRFTYVANELGDHELNHLCAQIFQLHQEQIVQNAPTPTDSQILEIRSQWGEILELIHLDPEQLFKMHYRAFEEFIAGLLERQKFRVELTQATRDGGRDILAFKEHALGNSLFFVETKRYAPHKLVGVDMVDRLYGVVQKERATAGVLVTTSDFTKPARESASKVEHQMSLRNLEFIKDWVATVRSMK